MDINHVTQATIKVIAHVIEFDWIHPFKIKTSRTSIGSGFFLDKSGYCLTNAHVINNAQKVDVEIPYEGNYKHEAEIVGLCFELDIALLQLKKYKPKFILTLGDSDEVDPGDTVVAIGFPLGQKNLKITKGIISGRQYGVLQTDTALNPGNSGGALIKDNKVIGINRGMILGTSNIGYAVPINNYDLIKNELMNKKKKSLLTRRTIIGFESHNVNSDLLTMLNSKCKKGVYLNYVFPDHPILKTGIKKGDILCNIDGKEIDEFGTVEFENYSRKMTIHEMTRTFKKDQMIPITYWNGKKIIKKSFKYVDYLLPIRVTYPMFERVEHEMLGGLIFMELTVNHMVKIGQKLDKFRRMRERTKSKIVLTDVLAGSEAKNMEILQSGDIIAEINHQKVSTIKEVREALLKPILHQKKYYMKVVDEYDEILILEMKGILLQEKRLSEQYRYDLNRREIFKKLKSKLK